MKTTTAIALGAALLAAPLFAPLARATDKGERYLDEVTKIVEKRFYARGDFDRAAFEEHRDALRADARAAPTARADLCIANTLLADLGASHTFLLPKHAYDDLYGAEMAGRQVTRFGVVLEERGEDGKSQIFVGGVLDGSAADAAGVLRGDEVLSVDGFPLGDSPRLVSLFDRGTGARAAFEVASHLTPDGSPSPAGDVPVKLLLRSKKGGPTRTVTIEARPWSRIEATRASVRTCEQDGKTIGYLHFYHVLHPEMARILEDAMKGPFKDAAAIIVDLRGWGGRVDVAQRILRDLESARWKNRVVCLIDERTRSAKEIMAFDLVKHGVSLIGRRTAGAVLAAGMIEVNPDAELVLAIQEVDSLSDGVRLEGHGVDPTIAVKDALPFAAGRDELIDAGLRRALEISAAREQPATAR